MPTFNPTEKFSQSLDSSVEYVRNEFLSNILIEDSTFLKLRRKHYCEFETDQKWVEISPGFTFATSRQHVAFWQSDLYTPCLGWEFRSWKSFDIGSEDPWRIFLKNMNDNPPHYWDICQLNGLDPRESATLAAAASRAGNSLHLLPFPIRIIPGSCSYEGFLKRRSKSINSDQRRLSKKIQKEGFSFRNEMPWQDIEQLYLVRSRSFANGMDYGKTPIFLKFLNELRQEYSNNNRWFEVGLYLDQKLIAFNLGFWQNKVFHCYQTAFDTQYLKLRPGFVIFEKQLEHVLNHGATLMEFMGDAPYLQHYGTSTLDFQRGLLFSRKLKWKLLAGYLFLKRFAQDLRSVRSRLRLAYEMKS